MAPNMIRPNQMLIFSPMCYVEHRRDGGRCGISSGNNSDCSSDMDMPLKPAKRTYVKNISPEEKILRKKLRNREAAQLSRDKKKAQFNILSGMVHGLRKENLQLKNEVEALRYDQEQLMAENERLREQLAESSRLEAVATEPCTPVVNDRISIEGPAVSDRHPLQKGKRNRMSYTMLCCQILYLLMTVQSSVTYSCQTMLAWTGLTLKFQNVWKKLQTNYLSKVFSMTLILMKWWGAHQRSWNPAKILAYMMT
ncbi:X-box-binding protein 1 isoform X2 [Adelges cooleyi]|uniref:X-box-binding protein 1 isoform X2 n=1 Tax=Adelges cooleyi TaxID=133065 RepID=UPI002180005A|nr:X-box-binding protein 1 isoform X2 [Adelges cooleyi]